jgi:hypothetical protein
MALRMKPLLVRQAARRPADEHAVVPGWRQN